MLLQIYDYAQYYLDLKEANLMVSSPPGGVPGSPNVGDVSNASPLQMQYGRDGQLLPSGRSGPWRIEYNFTSLYRLPHVSVNTLDALSRRVANNKSWFDTYFQANSVNLPSVGCNGECRKVQTCAISNIDYARYVHCVERGDGAAVEGGSAYDVKAGSAPTTNGTLATVTVAFLSLLLVSGGRNH